MPPRKLVLGIIALVTAVSTAFALNLPAPFSTLQVSAQTAKERKAEAKRLFNQGLEQFQTSQFEAALQYWQQALGIYREIQDREGEKKALGNLGLVYIYLGDYAKAIEYTQQVLMIARQIQDPQSEGMALGNLGNAYFGLGDYAKAIKYHQQVLAIALQIQDREGGSNAVNSLAISGVNDLAIAYAKLGNYDKAIKYHQQVLKIVRLSEDRKGEGKVLGNLGLTYNNMGDYAKAIEYHQQNLIIARQIQDHQSEGKALGNLGFVYINLGDYAKAIDYSQQWLAIARQIKDRESEGLALNNLGVALQKLGKLPEAEKILLKGIEVWESQRQRLGSKDSFKISIFEEQARTYSNLQKVLIVQNKTDEALEIAERGRARAFVELLQRRAELKLKAEYITPPPIIKLFKQTAKQQNATLVQFSIIDDDFKIENKLQSKESELYIWVIKPTGEVKFHRVDLKPLWQKQNTSLQDLVTKNLESLGVAKGTTRSVSARQTFAVGDFIRLNSDFPKDPAWEVVAVNLQNSTLKLRNTTWDKGTQTITRPFTDATKVSSPYAANIHSQQLHQLLIDPIADLLPKDKGDRIIFIPQSSLFFVPFPALQDADRKYLIQKHTILTAPSIQVLDLTRQKRQQISGTSRDVLVVGNPTMPKVSSYPGEPAQQLKPLPNSELEAKDVARMYKTNAIVGNKATKSAILPLLPKARIIHLATHGLLNDFTGGGIPGAIALAPEPFNKGKDERANGLLTASEIFDLKLNNTELVVLSACNTGVGRITGDGVIGLSRSLISAGVPSVIVSLWSIPDAPTASLMTEFYQRLQQGNDKASALRQAMLKTMEKHPEPKNWAAFTLIGSSD